LRRRTAERAERLSVKLASNAITSGEASVGGTDVLATAVLEDDQVGRGVA